jgi:hypothetical protein
MGNRPVILKLLTVIFASLSVASFYLLYNQPPDHAFSFAVSLMAALLHFAALAFYVRGTRYLHTNLKIAYSLMGVGVALLGLAIFQISIVNLFNWQVWVDSGGVLLPYLISVLLVFIGLRRFATSVDIKSRWLSIWYAFPIATAIGAAVSFLPHVPTPVDELTNSVTVALTTFISVLFVVAAKGTLIIKSKVGASYAHGLAWQFVGFASTAFAGFAYAASLIMTSATSWYSAWSMPAVFFIVAGWIFMKAGYAFSTIDANVEAKWYPQALRPFFGLTTDVIAVADVSSLDIIVYTMGLTSNPAAIDSLVDGMRVITSRAAHVNITLNDKDQQTLLHIYQQLEDYLVTKDPLRKIDRQAVRHNVEKHFGISSSSTDTFWPQLH